MANRVQNGVANGVANRVGNGVANEVANGVVNRVANKVASRVANGVANKWQTEWRTEWRPLPSGKRGDCDLPSLHTCTAEIHLPAYSSRSILRTKLLQAVGVAAARTGELMVREG